MGDEVPPRRFRLHDSIDADALAAEFAARGRVQIRPFLAEEDAARLAAHLAAREDWRLALSGGEGATKADLEFGRDELAAMSPARRAALLLVAAPRSAKGFGYLYERIVLADRGRPADPAGEAGAFAAWMASEEVLAPMRRITGAADIDFADAQASAYRPGHFLATHTDHSEGQGRRAAYVLGLTPRWRPEWGGLLMFHDGAGDVERALLPRMNALNLFRVPAVHSVSLVAPFAPASRYSITGWLRATGG